MNIVRWAQDKRAASALRRDNDRRFVELVEEVLADDILTEEEEASLTAQGLALGINDAQMRADFPDLLERLVVARINDGRLPVLTDTGGIIMKKNEVMHLSMNASLLKEVTDREWQGRSSGVSFRIVKGVRYHIGSMRGHSVVVGSHVEVADSGLIAVTSLRAIFVGSKRSLEFAYPKLLDVHVFEDGIRLAVSNRQAPSTFKLAGSGGVFAAALNAASQRADE